MGYKNEPIKRSLRYGCDLKRNLDNSMRKSEKLKQ